MTKPLQQRIFDGHNDVLLKLWNMADDQDGHQAAVSDFIAGCIGHIDVPRSRKGGFAGGFFAIYVPSPMDDAEAAGFEAEMMKPAYDLPLPEQITNSEALPVAVSQAAILMEMERQGAVKICRTVADIRSADASGIMAAVMHMEGAEAIGTNLEALDVLYAAGLRSLGPVWSRPTSFAEGVPFRYPSDGDIGAGLTRAGKELVRKCNELGVMLDMSHMNEKGFWDTAELSNAPIVATHSNAYAISAHSRNLTDAQLKAIADSNGMVGLNFATAFLREDGRMIANTPLSAMLAHMDHMISVCGEDHIGLGSDYDGATIPTEIKDVAGLPKLVKAMQDHGYGSALIEKLCFENWMRVLNLTWK